MPIGDGELATSSMPDEAAPVIGRLHWFCAVFAHLRRKGNAIMRRIQGTAWRWVAALALVIGCINIATGQPAAFLTQGVGLYWWNGTAWASWSTSNPAPVTNKPGAYTKVALDISTTTTAGVAVTALSAGHITAGGWIQNPPTAATNLCISDRTTATQSGGICGPESATVVPGASFSPAPGSGSVSVVSSDNSHAFTGEGLQ